MLDLNSADVDILVRQLKISPRLARRIIAMRPFESVADLQKVWGMDAQTYARLVERVMVSPPPTVAQAGPESPPPTVMRAPEEAVDEAPLPGKLEARELPRPSLQAPPQTIPARLPVKPARKFILALLAIVLCGAYLRFVGLNWDAGQHQHPDERFITMVAEKIRSVSIFEYLEFDTQNSSLNPLSHGSYTYGMLPLFVTRYVAEWINMTHYDRVVLVGRVLSGLFDLAVVVVLYWLGTRLYDRRVGLLAAALSAAAVLPIQLSHFFTVDSFSTVFVVAGFCFAAQVTLAAPGRSKRDTFLPYALFGLMTGLATACKVNTLPLFGVILLAGVATIWKRPVERMSELKNVLIGWAIAAVVAATAFRVFQPYAFAGPGFFGLRLNERWLSVMREVTDQVAGKSEWPPNHHWTSRPFTYAWTNMVMWGMGLPLGLAAWLGWAWAAWRCVKGEWQRHLLPVVWIAGYFIWQNIQFWRYMRYFLPIYPFLILLAAWALVELFDRTRGKKFEFQISSFKLRIPGVVGLIVLIGVLALTYVYAFAFTRIYVRPHTRIAASRWMLEHVPGPLNVIVNSPQGARSYPVRVSHEVALVVGQPVRAELRPAKSGTVTTITTTRVKRVGADLHIKISTDEDGQDVVTEGHLMVMAGDEATSQTLNLRDVTLEGGRTYYVHYALANSGALTANGLALRNELAGANGVPLEWTLTDQPAGKTEGNFKFAPGESQRINRLFIGNLQVAYAQNGSSSATTLEVKLTRDDVGKDVLAVASVTSDFLPGSDGHDQAPVFSFPSVELKAGTTYFVFYQVTSGGPLTLAGESMTLETSWDDALPLRVDNYDPLGGIYEPLNLELYEPDTVAKREKMLETLSQVNYIIVPSNRAYDAMPRLPLRYPMTLKYYQALFNCDCSGDAMEALAAQAKPPLKGPLGFELVATFESYPTFGLFSISDQLADESFTVYDHPKVMIFKKSADFSLDKARAILESADLTQILDQSPLAVTIMPTGLRLPPDRLAAQKAGGTWHQMFDFQSFLNQNQVFGVLAWYFFLLLLGWLAFPLVFVACRGLPDRGYPLARLIALLFIAWVAWMLGSLKILPFTQGTLWLSVGVMALVSGSLCVAMRNRTALTTFVRTRWRYLLGIEGLFLALFLFDLAIRLGNPDLWHPWLGGEKPMDFAFFNSVLKAVYFPPENPWFAGNYVNYYYYGYVIAAVLTKLLGIVPSIAYNLVLPTWYAMTGAGAFCVTCNLVSRTSSGVSGAESEETAASSAGRSRLPYLAGVVAVILMLVLGNLYQVRQLWQYLPEVSEPGQTNLAAPEYVAAVISGASRVLSGQAQLPGDKGRWYFGASRPILHDKPDTPIAEFPFFSFLYADLHPHVLAMPILFAALAWMLSVLYSSSGKRTWSERIAMWFMAGLVFGVMRPTHTWDLPTLLGLGALALTWKVWRTEGVTRKALIMMTGQVALLVGVAIVMYYPFAQWFGTEYTSLELWKGARTPLVDYLTVHGLFLFILVTFLVWETRVWVRANRPTWFSTSLDDLIFQAPTWMKVGAGIVILGLVVLWISNYQVLVLGLPLLIWVGLLLMRRNSTIERQIVLGLLAVGVGLTMFVEVVVLQGDVGRSNTVFRFYIQVWALFSVAAAAALMWLIPVMRDWRCQSWSRKWRWGWWGVLAVLVLAAGTYTVTGTQMKIADRWPDITHPPGGLDGMAYMLGDDPTQTSAPKPAVYTEGDHPLILSTDYASIRFMQDHVPGTPTIVEGHVGEYRWGSRYSIYTGLPTVVGWSWHVRQHNSLLPGAVIERRIAEVNDFYNTADSQAALEFLRRYQVEYIVAGDLERALYSAEGMNKFEEWMRQGRVQEFFSRREGASLVTIYKVVHSQ